VTQPARTPSGRVQTKRLRSLGSQRDFAADTSELICRGGAQSDARGTGVPVPRPEQAMIRYQAEKGPGNQTERYACRPRNRREYAIRAAYGGEKP
jgi:hypothetical protein